MPSMRTKRRVFSRKRVYDMRTGKREYTKYGWATTVTFGYMLWRGKTIKDMKYHKKLWRNWADA